MYKAVIYDLDDTIIPTSRIPESTFKPVYDALLAANNNGATERELYTAFQELWRKPIDVVAAEYDFSVEMINACRNALTRADYEMDIMPFDDVEVIQQIEGLCILVTTGITKLQQAKINALFKEGDFDEIIIDDPYEDNRLGKQKIFSLIAERYQLKPEQVWIIGDNPDSEIAAGNALGMHTVHILRPGVKQSDKAKYTVNSFHEFAALIAHDMDYPRG